MVKSIVHHGIEDVAAGPLSVGDTHIGPTAGKQTEKDMLLLIHFVKSFYTLLHGMMLPPLGRALSLWLNCLYY